MSVTRMSADGDSPKVTTLRWRSLEPTAHRAGVVGGDHDRLACGVGEPDERIVEGLMAAIGLEMIGVDVGDQRDGGVVEQEGLVRFVGLDDEQVVLARAARGAVLLDDAAVDVARVGADAGQRGDDHAGRCRLAVGARDRHEASACDQIVQRLRAVQHRDSPLLRREELRVLRPDRPGVHDGVDVAEVGCVVTDRDSRPAP